MSTSDLFSALDAVLPEKQIKAVEGGPHPLGNGGKVAVYPETEQQIAGIVEYADEHGMKIAVTGRGTKRGWGGLEEPADILLSLEKYTGIVEHSVGDMTMTVKSGTLFGDLQEHLAGYRQKISLDPAWPEHATLGGVIAANDSGPKRLGYGSARDSVIGLRVVYAGGRIIRSGGKVVKNVAGYDMNKLFIGSMGTLGVVSEITVRLRPLCDSESLVLIGFDGGEGDTGRAGGEEDEMEHFRSFAVELLNSQLEPVAIELLSPGLSEKLTGRHRFILAIGFEDVDSAVRYQEEFIRNMRPTDANMSILSQEETRSFWDRLSRIYPVGVDVTNTVQPPRGVAGSKEKEDFPGAVGGSRQDETSAMDKSSRETVGNSTGRDEVVSGSGNYTRDNADETTGRDVAATGADDPGRGAESSSRIRATVKVGVRNLDVLKVLLGSRTLEEKHNVIAEAHGGLGHGLCKVVLEGRQEDIVAAIGSLRGVVRQLGGHAVVTHLPLNLRRDVDVWGEKPAYFNILEGIKRKVDPRGTLNYRRFVGGL